MTFLYKYYKIGEILKNTNVSDDIIQIIFEYIYIQTELDLNHMINESERRYNYENY